MGLNVNIAAFDLDQNDVKGDKAVLETGRDLVNLFKHVLRTRPATASNLDKALDALRRLNIVHADIKERHKRWQLREESPLWKQQVTFADAEEKEDFRRFLDRTSPAELIRHLQRARPEPPTAGEEVDSEADSAPESEPEEGDGEGEGGPA